MKLSFGIFLYKNCKMVLSISIIVSLGVLSIDNIISNTIVLSWLAFLSGFYISSK